MKKVTAVVEVLVDMSQGLSDVLRAYPGYVAHDPAVHDIAGLVSTIDNSFRGGMPNWAYVIVKEEK